MGLHLDRINTCQLVWILNVSVAVEERCCANFLWHNFVSIMLIFFSVLLATIYLFFSVELQLTTLFYFSCLHRVLKSHLTTVFCSFANGIDSFFLFFLLHFFGLFLWMLHQLSNKWSLSKFGVIFILLFAKEWLRWDKANIMVMSKYWKMTWGSIIYVVKNLFFSIQAGGSSSLTEAAHISRDIDISPGQPLQSNQSSVGLGVIGRRSVSDLGAIGDNLSGATSSSGALQEQLYNLQMLEAAFYKLPQPKDSERTKNYIPVCERFFLNLISQP